MNTIPCSIAIITSKADGLEKRLKALGEFGEIVICHGNAPEENLQHARRLGAKVVRQYDTDEPLLNSMTDKAAVRQVAMDASTLPWRFFMDRDDELSPETISEIRSITTNPSPTHLVWRMPTRIFLEQEDGSKKEILHEATYPSYQTRLVHASVGAHFKGLVHERLVFDEKKFSVGTMHSYYNFIWGKARVVNFWKYIGGYAERELEVAEYSTFKDFLYFKIYKRIRTILGYLLWRLPTMYVSYGFKDSMPLRIELLIARYHLAILWGSVLGYISSRVWFILLRETLRGKDLNRTLTNLASREFEAYGRVLDVGGGDGSASYWRFMWQARWHRKKTLDVVATHNPDYVADLETQQVSAPDNYFDTIMMMNVLEHINNRDHVMKEMFRLLREDGALVGIIPFLVNVHPDPNDYVRLTRQGLECLFYKAGFSKVEIVTVGRGPITASYYQSEFLFPRVLKVLLLPVVLTLDRVVLALRPVLSEKFPLSYAFRLRK